MTISTHVLDTGRGKPAAGVGVSLHAPRDDGGWDALHTGVTDADGRAGPLDAGSAAGPRRLVFATESVSGFFPEVAITFVPPPGEHCHVPLLLSPFGYSTYRGT
jgi:5-hydroxyisourate hydrolase